MSLNKVQIMGRIVKDPTLATTNNGVNVCNITLAVDRDASTEQKTDFIDCVAWRNTAEFICKYFRKGMKAVVAGNLQVRDWKDKNGNPRRAVEVVVESIYFCEKKQAEQADGQTWSEDSMSREEYDSLFEDVNQDEDSLPF